MKGPMLEQFVKDCIPWKGPYVGPEEQCGEAGVSEAECYQQTATPIPHPLHCSEVRLGEEEA